HDVGVAEVLQDPNLSQRPDRHRLLGDRRTRELERDRLVEVGRADLEHPGERTAPEHREHLELAVVLPGAQIDLDGRLAHRRPQYCKTSALGGCSAERRDGPDPARLWRMTPARG